MDIDEEEAAWDIVRDRINFDVESGEFIAINKKGEKPIPVDDGPAEEDGEGTQNILDLDNQQAGPSAQKVPRMGPVPGRKAMNQMVDSLIGQANLEHVRGRIKEAMAFLFEAIKMSPYHAQTYRELSHIYAELGQMEKGFEFKMLAALLSAEKTEATEWEDIADMAQTFGRLELAVASLAKAIRRDSINWIYYEKRIEILTTCGDVELAMRTRLQAAQNVTSQGFAWIDKHIKIAADYYCTLKDEERATEALETFILRSREFGRPIEFEHLALLGMWMGKDRYEEAAKSILALHQHLVQPLNGEDGSPAIQVDFTSGYTVHPFPPPPHIRWIVDPSLPTMLLCHLVVCLVHLQHFHLMPDLVDALLERTPDGAEQESAILEIGRALHGVQQVGLAIDFMAKLRAARPEFADSADAWFLYGYFHQLLDHGNVARDAYEQVIAIHPGHIDARINLSTILQQMGEGELALETLKDLNLDASCSQIPNERLLVRQAEMLLERRKSSEQYINCLRMLLIPHFYNVHLMGDEAAQWKNAARSTQHKTINLTLKRRAMEAIRGTMLERMVKRLGSIAFENQRSTEELNANELHDYAFKLSEALHLAGAHEEMLVVVCYAFLHPRISELGSHTFNNLLFFASINARNFPLAFEFVRFHMAHTLPRIKGEGGGGEVIQPSGSIWRKEEQLGELMKRMYVAMNFILCQHQSVNYHRFIMRQLVKQPDADALHIISGNNSLVTGAYRHALGEYFGVWLRQRHNPMLAFLIGITFAHISCKKDISSRHVVGIRAFAFMNKYATLRAPSLCQEVQYNMGRLFHQMGILPNAIQCYERVLYECPTPLVWLDDPGGLEAPRPEPAERYDLRRQAAYNLSLIYESSGNRPMARHILEQFCTI